MARRFRFRPEVLLRLRQRREDAARAAVEQAGAAVDLARTRLLRLSDSLRRHENFVRQAAIDGQADVTAYRGLIHGLRTVLADEKAAAEAACGELLCRRQELLHAMRQRKAVARLKERLAARHSAAVDRQLAKEWEDMHAAHQAARSEVATCPE